MAKVRLNWTSSISVFFAGIHTFENDHLHGGKAAVIGQDKALVQNLIELGVPADHIDALLDDQATTGNCKSRLKSLIAKAKPGDFLLFVIHSHGSLKRGGLVCTYETGGTWTFDELIGEIEQDFASSHAALCVAACHSGSLLGAIKSKPRRIAYFGLTSVHSDVSALTVATSDFEACIRDALTGRSSPDLNHDGHITFAEFGKYVCDDQSTLFGTVPDFGWTDNFNPEIIVNAALSPTGAMDGALVKVGGGYSGRVIKQNGDQLLVRGAKRQTILQWVNSKSVTRLGAISSQ